MVCALTGLSNLICYNASMRYVEYSSGIQGIDEENVVREGFISFKFSTVGLIDVIMSGIG